MPWMAAISLVEAPIVSDLCSDSVVYNYLVEDDNFD